MEYRPHCGDDTATLYLAKNNTQQYFCCAEGEKGFAIYGGGHVGCIASSENPTSTESQEITYLDARPTNPAPSSSTLFSLTYKLETRKT